MPQTIGKRKAGGDRGGCEILALKNFMPSFDNQPERAPMDCVRRIPNAYCFHVFVFTDNHPEIGYDKARQGIPAKPEQFQLE